jgi:hypothetical protein
MTADRVKRKPAAILVADIAGYSRLMSADGVGTLARFKECRHGLIDPQISGPHPLSRTTSLTSIAWLKPLSASAPTGASSARFSTATAMRGVTRI